MLFVPDIQVRSFIFEKVYDFQTETEKRKFLLFAKCLRKLSFLSIAFNSKDEQG
jgi:hypothetical protein